MSDHPRDCGCPCAHPDRPGSGELSQQCRDVLEDMYLYLDGELTDERRETIRVHLDDCTECLETFGLEFEVKSLVARCCEGGECPPEGMRERVVERLRALVGDLRALDPRGD